MPLPALRSPAWRAALRDVPADPATDALEAFLAGEREGEEPILPPADQVFTAYDLVAPDAARVVVVGQDPYPTPGHAHGLAFSYRGEGALPGSLRNIFREVEEDLGVSMPRDRGDLTPWARQGVLLLNAVLTVRAAASASHRRRGWERITDATLEVLSQRPRPLVFMLWGGDARKKRKRIAPHHHVLEAGHPSPLSVRHFRGCRHFSQANERLGDEAIDWQL